MPDLFEQLAAQGAMIDRLTADSRRCAPGAAFFAYPGEAADGRAYIADAVRRGAAERVDRLVDLEFVQHTTAVSLCGGIDSLNCNWLTGPDVDA